jgi:hypothetical protein
VENVILGELPWTGLSRLKRPGGQRGWVPLEQLNCGGRWDDERRKDRRQRDCGDVFHEILHSILLFLSFVTLSANDGRKSPTRRAADNGKCLETRLCFDREFALPMGLAPTVVWRKMNYSCSGFVFRR